MTHAAIVVTLLAASGCAPLAAPRPLVGLSLPARAVEPLRLNPCPELPVQQPADSPSPETSSGPTGPADEILVYRTLEVGAAIPRATRTDYVLEQFDGENLGTVRLTVVTFEGLILGLRLQGPELLDRNWHEISKAIFVGKHTNYSHRILDLYKVTTSDGSAPTPVERRLELVCHDGDVPALAAGAKSVDGDCEWAPLHRWIPFSVHHVPTYTCQQVASPNEVFHFHAAPGIELARENSDCWFQGRAFREVGKPEATWPQR